MTPLLRRVLAVMLALAVVAGGIGAWWAWQSMRPTSYESAVSLLPESTLRATYTDWARVRSLADGTDLGAASTTRDVRGFLSRAYDLDLTGTSAVVDATYALNRRFGFSPLDADWEMFGQSREGQVVVMRFGESVDLEGVERNLRRLGYGPPADGGGSGGVWAGSADLVATIDPSLTPVMQYLVVLPSEGLVLLSDSKEYAAASARVVDGSAPGLDEVPGVVDLAEAAGEPASAVLFADDFACEALGMASADEQDRALADDLVTRAGGVSPLAGVVVSLHDDRTLLVGLHFESADQAAGDLGARVDLASGEAPGQGGRFSERFGVVEAWSEDQQIVMQLEPLSPDLPLLSDLTQGPLLFASC